ncbi:MAG: YjbH domain-containing protein [Pseudomonadota bacterium]
MIATADPEAILRFDLERPVLSTYAMPGYIDMPSAEMQPDGHLTFSAFYRQDSWRGSVNFQATKRLSGTFRYAYLDEPLNAVGSNFYDRSFSVAYRFIDEGVWRPAVAVGILDLVGTGVYGAEYVVASKTLPNKLSFSIGMGWGRFGSYNGFTNPLGIFGSRWDTRPGERESNDTGTFTTAEWFRGDAAIFGGLSYKPSDRLTLTAEYSSDAYDRERRLGEFDRRASINFGLNYRAGLGTDIGVYYLYGSALSAVLHLSINPNQPLFQGGREGAPPPVVVREEPPPIIDPGFGPGEWTPTEPATASLTSQVASALASQGIELVSLEVGNDLARMRLRNQTYDSEAQAVGRAARVVSGIFPPEIEYFEFVPMDLGIPLATITVSRSDLESLEFDPDRSWKSYVRAEIGDAAALDPISVIVPGIYPEASAGIKPFVSTAFFDPDNPLRIDVGLDLDLSYSPLPGLIFSSKYRQRLAGNRSEATRESDSTLPPVRSDITFYDQDGSSFLAHLTTEYFWRPGTNLYGRGTVGYLERMYAGLSSEVLWKPVTGPLALGAEINYVRQRDFNGRFGFLDYEVATGHASVYYEIGGGFEGQIDAGRYLAGDWGGTFTLRRRFASGWQVGAFFTLTDVPFSEFGEGAFDKGLFFEAPISWLSGQPSRQDFAALIKPLSRDGGARLFVRNRLYEVTRDYHDPELQERWPRYWR